MVYVVAYDGQSRVVRVLCVLEGCAAEWLSYAYWVHLPRSNLIGRVVAMVFCVGQLRLLW